MFDQLTILAPGLLGASLGMAAKAAGTVKAVHVWARRQVIRDACLRMDWCDRVFANESAAVEGADIVVVCAPVDIIPALVNQVRPALTETAIITDVGSTKGSICGKCAATKQFIGSHPMAGSEKAGMDSARVDLFQNMPCLVTPLEGSQTDQLHRLCAFWESIGMQVSIVTPQEHDRIVARISHLPHLLASALARQLEEEPRELDRFAGNGLRDTTRVAAGSPSLWRSIFANNTIELLKGIGAFEAQLAEAKALLEAGRFAELESFLADGQRFRKRWK